MGTSDGKGRLLTANSDGLMAEGWRRDSGGGVGCVECRGVRLSRQRMTQASSYRWLELLARSASEYHEGLRVSSTDARQVDRRRLTRHACDRVCWSPSTAPIWVPVRWSPARRRVLADRTCHRTCHRTCITNIHREWSSALATQPCRRLGDGVTLNHSEQFVLPPYCPESRPTLSYLKHPTTATFCSALNPLHPSSCLSTSL
jgi:hypothetical protein